MMCKVCGERFLETDVSRGYEEYPYGEAQVRACIHSCCPSCGSQELCEEGVCVQCGEEVNEADMVNGFCRFCAEELEQTLEWILSMLTPAQIRWIAAHPEWIERGETVC